MRGFLMAAAAASLAMAAGSANAHSIGIDGGLYAVYEASDTIVRFTVCGKLPESDGCYGGGQVAPLEKACAVVEGKRKQNVNVVTRDVYVLDKRTSKNDPVLLYVYRRIDTITLGKFDDVKFKFLKRVALSITGGANSHCAMAANDQRIFVGTDAYGVATSMDKRDFSTRDECPFGTPIEAITADARGFVTIRVQGAFCVVNDNGDMVADGGGAADMVGQRGAWLVP